MDQPKNPFDESPIEVSNVAEASQAHLDDPFNESYEPSETVASNTTVTETESTTDKACSEIQDSCQPKPEYPQGVLMQTQGQPFNMPQGDPNQAADPNAGQPQGNAPAFNPSEANQGQPQNQNAGQGFGQGQGQPQGQGGNQGFNPNQGQNQGFQQPQGNQGFSPNQNQGGGGFSPNQNQGGGGFNPNQQNNGGFGGNQNQNFGGNQNNGYGGNQGGFQNQNNEKFAIIDMFWFVNKKMYANQALDQGEAQILTVGFNASFNNMRIGMSMGNEGAFTDTSIIIGNCARLANFNIFSEHALQILHVPNTPHRIFERVIRAGSWNPNPSQITNNGDSFLIQSTNTQTGNTHSFLIAQEQAVGFKHALEFLLNGQSWSMAMTGQMNR